MTRPLYCIHTPMESRDRTEHFLQTIRQSRASAIPQPCGINPCTTKPRARPAQQKHTMSGAYAIFAFAVALALTFVFTIHQWLAKEDELARH
jgi:hypothetical protein